MPKKLVKAQAVPTLVAERLRIWGRCIRAQRVAQHIPARDLAARMGVSDATLRRLEQGDPGASASAYLAALMVLGVLDTAAPELPAHYWSIDPKSRARALPTDGDDGYF